MSQEQIIVGGQAVIEGVMMRAPHSYAVAVRRPDGQIVSTAERLPVLSDKHPVLKLPVLRGAAVLVQSMALGVRALNFSASVAFEGSDKDRSSGQEQSGKKGTATAISSMIFALIFNVVLFIVLPLLLTNMIFVYGAGGGSIAHEAGGAWYANAWAWVQAAARPVRPSILFNLVDGLIRITFFLIMIVGFTFMRDIRRVFQYHGAEHKVVYTWEAGEALTVENARRKQRQHPRCGTSFLMIVMLVAIAAFSVLKFDSLPLNFCVRVLMIPVIAGVSYEIVRASARTSARWFFSTITRPGLWLQNLTTREPDDSQLEVAIFALEESLKLEPEPKALALAYRG